MNTAARMLLCLAMVTFFVSPCAAQTFSVTYGAADAYYLAESIEKTADGGYVVVGYTNSFGSGSNDCWVLKLRANGEIDWQKSYGGTGLDSIRSISQTADGGYIAAGSTGSHQSDMWVLKLDADGNALYAELGIKCKAVSIPVEHLHYRFAAITESKEMPREGSRSSTPSTMMERPLMDLRISVAPGARKTRVWAGRKIIAAP